MATYTTAEMRNFVLREIGVLPEGETPSAAHAEVAEQALDAVHNRLDGQGLLNWPPSAVPSAIFRSVVRLAAAELINEFGLSDTQVARLAAGAAAGEREIRQQVSVGWTDRDTVKAKYY
jgi:hypothetical protein